MDDMNNDFSYRSSKDGKVFISWFGKPVMTLKGQEARKLLNRLQALDEVQVQLALAKVTGNFKRGNER
jgi:hypothetical protein